ncbi:MAG TPA: SusC/RagA family TonB-linked outer membrane protein, partial [Gemmatimonadaceae bacterium]|nr:SusC/RagA family TonB-linked outer membrane protein [Gemmatimonadaceae bacterium]
MALVAVLASPQTLQAQTRDITGTVTVSGTTVPLADATVSVIGTTAVTRTNQQGQFRLQAPAGEVTVAARAIGYKRQLTAVPAGQATVNFALERDVLQLEGVVVTGQATTVERQNAAVAVSSVNTEQLNRVPSQALESALQGKVVGAQINMNSGAPGGGGQIQIRGVTTILGNGEPLYVVDGVIISNAQIQSGMNAVTGAGGSAGSSIAGAQDNASNRLADINPSSIESIEILKGAAASAIYGSRATNGVVVITTKRGQSGAPRFDVTQRLGTYTPLNPIGMRRFLSKEDALEAIGARPDAQAIVDSVWALNPNPSRNYLDELYDARPLAYETVATVTGGTETGTRYFVSASTKRDGGIMPNTGARQSGLRINLDQDFGDKWSVSAGSNIVRSTTDRGVSNNDNGFISPLYAFGYTPNILDLKTRDANGNYPENPFPGGGGSNASNPFQTIAYLKNNEDVWRMIGSARVSYEAVQTDVHNLRFSFNGGVDRFNQANNIYSPNFLQFEGNDDLLGTAVRGSGNSLLMNGSLNAVHAFSPRAFPAVFTTSAGVSQEYADLRVNRVLAEGLIPGIELTNQGKTTLDDNHTRIVDQAFYAQEEISAFDDRLQFNLGVRADRSSANGDVEKFYFFPKGSAAYVFRAPVSGVDRVKFRAALAQSGNRPDFGVRNITLLNNGRIGGVGGIGANGTLGNPNVKPEVMTEQEFGIDATFLDDRIGLEATYFDRSIKDLYLRAPLAQSTGLTTQIFNGGELTSNGFELGLTVNPLRNWHGITWVSRANYYTIDQKITELPIPSFPVGSSGFGVAFGRARIREGHSPTAIWGNMPFYKAADGSLTPAPVGVYVTDKAAVAAGRVVRQEVVIAESTPDFQIAFPNDFTYGNFTLNFLLDWKKGGFVSNLTNNLFDEGKTSYDFDEKVTVKREGLADTTYRRGDYRYQAWNQGSDARLYIQDGSYVKLRELTLGYQVPETLTQRVGLGVRNLRVSLSGRNLMTWSDYWGSDPEVNNFGNQTVARFVDLAPFPPSRSFFFSV